MGFDVVFCCNNGGGGSVDISRGLGDGVILLLCNGCGSGDDLVRGEFGCGWVGR